MREERSWVDDFTVEVHYRRNACSGGYGSSTIVGFMFPSDYGFAVGGEVGEKCLGKILGSYNTDNCKDNNWFYNTLYQWTVTSVYVSGNDPDAAILSSSGEIDAMWSAAQAVDTKPVVYLKRTVTIYDGKGTSDESYLLKIVS